MKNIYLLGMGAIALALFGCAFTRGENVSKAENFKGKTGIIGVFRQPAYYCGEGIPHTIMLGGTSIIVKSAFSTEQENVFFSEMKPGIATLTEYKYNCGEDEKRMVLDTTSAGSDRFQTSLVIPEKGFCKVVISFLEGDTLFSYNNDILKEQFAKAEVAVNTDSIPFCEIRDNKGEVVSMASRDSILDAKFDAAVKDASEALEEEKFTVVTLDDFSDKVSWNADKTQLLVVSLTSNPDSYKEGETVKADSVIWVVNEKELLMWFQDHKDGVRDWDLRFKQLFGEPRTSRATHMAFLWVSPNDLMRPAYVPDVKAYDMRTSFEGNDADNTERMMWFKNWFDARAAKSYEGPDARPWTRLGYTYDWGSDAEKYGLTEYIVTPGANMEVRFTRNLKFVANWMKDRK
ncbi:MAG: hypothetical protein IIT53_02030 [Fibrobacter sp.]|nr:hypothetical protein [Fibrobacter sp.]